ncbi:MAG: hypothetical protein IJ852_03330 [Alphaproteobacteria bacterium]|nr:hypothetical protein [Alphaproteobacteria bacterium]
MANITEIIKDEYAKWSRSSDTNDKLKATALATYLGMQANDLAGYKGDLVQYVATSSRSSPTDSNDTQSNSNASSPNPEETTTQTQEELSTSEDPATPTDNANNDATESTEKTTQYQMTEDWSRATNTLEYVANSTPTYFYDFLSRCPAIDDERRPSKWMNSRELKNYLHNTNFTEGEKEAILKYVTIQSAHTRLNWSDIRARGGSATSSHNQAGAVIAELQKQQSASDNTQQDQPSASSNSSGNLSQEQTENGTSQSPTTPSTSTQAQTEQNTSPQPKQPTYPHLPQNLISAVTYNTEEMYNYFRRHSKSCGNFKEADVLDTDGKPNAAKMLGWLEDHYPYFKESRKQKIDKACRKHDLDHYVYPPLEDERSRTQIIGYMNRHYESNMDSTAESAAVAAAYRKLTGSQRSELEQVVEDQRKQGNTALFRQYGHATGGEKYDQENTEKAGKKPDQQKEAQAKKQANQGSQEQPNLWQRLFKSKSR